MRTMTALELGKRKGKKKKQQFLLKWRKDVMNLAEKWAKFSDHHFMLVF